MIHAATASSIDAAHGRLAERVDADARLQRLAPVALNIVCLRYVGAAPDDAGGTPLDEAALDALNAELHQLENAGAGRGSLLDPETGERFWNEILAVGGSRPALESFKAFRGREPQVDALLRHSGMVGA